MNAMQKEINKYKLEVLYILMRVKEVAKTRDDNVACINVKIMNNSIKRVILD